MNFRISRKGELITISDDPKNHTHDYHDTVVAAVKARADEFRKDIPSQFTLLVEYDKKQRRFNAMTNNAQSSLKKKYRPLYKKRPAVLLLCNDDLSFDNAVKLLKEADIAYVIPK